MTIYLGSRQADRRETTCDLRETIPNGSGFCCPTPTQVAAAPHQHLVLLILTLLLTRRAHTVFGRYVFAIGGNEPRRLCGIRVDGMKVLIYAWPGCSSAWPASINCPLAAAIRPRGGLDEDHRRW